MTNPFAYLREVFWGKPAATAAERKLIRKIDAFILSYVCLSYCINYLDRSNLANAYVSGMKEDVGFTGNTYTYANSCFTAGYVIGNAVWGFVISSQRIPIRYILPSCMLIWGFLTLGTGFVKSYQAVYGIRLVAGIFEAATFGGTHYVLGSWYLPSEVGKRAALFTAASQGGSLFSGVLAGAIIDTLEGKSSLKGWQWLFVIDFIITMPVAVYGLLCFPDTPRTTKAWWLTDEERELAVSRLGAHSTHHEPMTRATLKKTAKKAIMGYRYYLFCALFTISATSFESGGVYTQWALYMKSTYISTLGKFSTADINYYPTILVAVAMVTTFMLTAISDHLRSRLWVNYIMYASVFIMAVIALNMAHVHYTVMFFAYSISGLGYAGQASNFAWANDLIRDDETLRALTLYSMNMFSNIWALWYGIVAYPVTTAPEFKRGQIACLVTGFVSIWIATAIWYLNRRYPQDLSHNVDHSYEVEGEKTESLGDEKENGPSSVAIQPVLAI